MPSTKHSAPADMKEPFVSPVTVQIAARYGLPKRELGRCTVEAVAHLPQKIAAETLSVSHSSLKKACRALGFSRWPRARRVQAHKYELVPDSLTPDEMKTLVPDDAVFMNSLLMMVEP